MRLRAHALAASALVALLCAASYSVTSSRSYLRSEVNIELNFPLKLRGARSRLYRRRFLQVNTRWKALAEIYTMHSFAPLSCLKIFIKISPNFAKFYRDVAIFFQNFATFWRNFAGILPEFAKLCGNLLNFHKVRKRNRRQQGAAPRNNFKTLHSANVRSF